MHNNYTEMFPFMIMFAKQAMTIRRISAAAVLIRVILFAATVPDLAVDAVSLTANEEYRREYLRLQGPQRASTHRGGRQHDGAGSSTRRTSGTNASTPTSSDNSDIELHQHYTATAVPDTCDACADDLCRRMRKCDRRLAAHGLCSLSQAAVCSLATAGVAVLGVGAWNVFKPVPPCRTYLYLPGGLLEEAAASASEKSLAVPATSSTSRGATTGGPDGVHQPVSTRGGRLLLQVEEANRRLADREQVLDEKQRRPRFLAAAMTEHSGASPKDTLTEIPGYRLFRHFLEAGESSDSTVTRKFNYPDIFQSDVCSDLIIPQNAAEYQDGVAMPAYVKCDPRNLDECLIPSGKFS